MQRWTVVAAALFVTVIVCSAALHGKPACSEQARVMTPQKLEGQVVKVDPAQNRLSVSEADGTMHEFKASRETLQAFKVGDRIEARRRGASRSETAAAPAGCGRLDETRGVGRHDEQARPSM
jgi:hypothetical protein